MASTTFVTIDGVNFTKRQHDALVSKALKVADDNEYCDEAEKMLTAVGLTVPSPIRTVTLTLKVNMLQRGHGALVPADFEIADGHYGDLFDVESVLVTE